jgi:hypothetical protein
MKTNFEPHSTAAASDPTPARLSLIRFPAICVAALCLSTNLFAAPVEMTFDGVNGVTSFGVYVSPYYGTIDGTPVDLFCVDFSNEVHFGEQWAANLTPISSAADLGDTRWGAQPDALVHYEEAAWLALQFASQPVDQYGDIQATMWQLFYPGAPSPSSSFWLDQAQSNYASADYQNFAIITNTGPVQPSGQVQELLAQLPSNGAFNPFAQVQTDVAPEPGTQAMIGVVLVVVGWVGRRRHQSLLLRFQRP